MRNKIYDEDKLEIWAEGDFFYLRYDVGAHQIAIREDEISKDEVEQIMNSSDEATKVLFALQRRLKNAGICPYESNTLD